MHPIIDEYYNASPSFKRSAAFAETKGQITNEIVEAEMDMYEHGGDKQGVPTQAMGRLQMASA